MINDINELDCFKVLASVAVCSSDVADNDEGLTCVWYLWLLSGETAYVDLHSVIFKTLTQGFFFKFFQLFFSPFFPSSFHVCAELGAKMWLCAAVLEYILLSVCGRALHLD